MASLEVPYYQVLALEQSIIESAFPMSTISTPEDIKEEMERELTADDIKRAIRLGKVPTGTGHDCFLKGVVVRLVISAPQYWWLQAGRYHFQDITSSQSKMHKLTKMDLHEQCNEYVFTDFIAKLNKFIPFYNNYEEYKKEHPEGYSKKELFHIIVSNTPMGLKLTAGFTTNYLQLKTIYNQRAHHKLQEWRQFISWMEQLPRFKEFIKGGE